MWIVVLRLTLAFIFLILGIAGLFLPVLQGWLFLLIAAILFFPRHHRVDSVLKKAEPRWPRLVGLLRRIGVGEPLHEPTAGPGPASEPSGPALPL